jgi:hypothetical protein
VIPFEFERAVSIGEAAVEAGSAPKTRFSRRRHQPDRPDEGNGGAAFTPDRYQWIALRQDRRTFNGGLRLGALVRNADTTYNSYGAFAHC